MLEMKLVRQRGLKKKKKNWKDRKGQDAEVLKVLLQSLSLR